MSHRDRESEKNEQIRPRRRAPFGTKTPAGGGGFLSKEDLSSFLSIKPYLSEGGQTVVTLLEEITRSGGRFDQANLARLMGMFGGNSSNLAMLGPLLANLTGGGGAKLDPSTILPLLGSLNQVRPPQETSKSETEEDDRLDQ